jgi:hypothetical protein
MIARLSGGGRSGADTPPGRARARPARTDPIRADLVFALRCLAVIFPMSIVVGGWIGVAAVIAALGVTLRMLLR